MQNDNTLQARDESAAEGSALDYSTEEVPAEDPSSLGAPTDDSPFLADEVGGNASGPLEEGGATAAESDMTLPEDPGFQDPGAIDFSSGDPSFLDMIPWALSLGTWLLLFIIVAGAVYAVGSLRRRSRERRLSPSGDTTRFALGSAVLLGSQFRRRVIAEDRHICRAKAPEIGLDHGLLVKACEYYERRNVAFSWVIMVTLLMAFLWPLLTLMPAALALVKQWYDRFVLARPYKKENFSLQAAEARFGTDSPPFDQNVICYGTTNPFVGLGEWISSWSVPVDTTRSSPGRNQPPEAVTVGELHETLDRSLNRLAVKGMSARDVVFVGGTEIADFPTFLPGPHCRPAREADNDTISRLKSTSDYRARVYRWITIADWDGDLVYSYLYRCEKRGEVLFFEATQLVLSPVAAYYRSIDDLPRTNIRTFLAWLFVALLVVPLVIISSLVTVYLSIASAWNQILQSEERRQRREVNDAPSYNYGAITSTRDKMSSGQSDIYFQIIDRSLIAQMLNHQVLKTLIEYLIERGVDTSIIETQAMTVINSSTFVNKGSIVSNSQVTGTIAGAAAKIGSTQQARTEKAS